MDVGPLKPEYLFRPSQLARRLRAAIAGRPARSLVRLPWGLPIEVATGETIGRGLYDLGVYDLPVSEVLWRLTDPGDHCADIGANVGVFSGLLAIRAGPGGAVRALEPHPEIHHDLCETVRRWRAAPGLADIEVCAAAAAATDGRAELVEPEAFGANRGRATLFPPVGEERRRSWSVTTVTLDGFLHDWAGVGVLKVDVEGAEPAVLDGARHLLAGGRIRDIVLEDHAPQPSVLADRLRAVGYRVWAIASTFWGPHLADPARLRPSPYLAPSLLATLEPDRAVARLAAAGWRCLRS